MTLARYNRTAFGASLSRRMRTSYALFSKLTLPEIIEVEGILISLPKRTTQRNLRRLVNIRKGTNYKILGQDLIYFQMYMVF